MRVIAGSARRSVLLAPHGLNTRPTADRIKENLFNIISPYVPGARFLDLFCGSGAIGIEALSRGACEAVFVDTSKEAMNVTQANIVRTRLTGLTMHMCTLAATSQLEGEGRAFDIIFLDPPYGSDMLGQTLKALDNSPLLCQDGILIAECSVNEEVPELAHLILQDTREYGNTRLMFYKRGDQ